MKPDKQVEAKIDALLAQMTLEEKIAQMVQIPYPMLGRKESLRWAERGAGSFLHVLGKEAQEVQETALRSRLGIPVLFGIDAVRGHALNDHATIFPTQLACACTWDKDLLRRMGRVTAKEVAADGLHWTFSPLLCLARDTRWGRCNETFGEDPYLTGELASAMIQGYQGEDLADEDSILACAKHYIAYGEAVGARDACDSELTYRKIREVFLPPFQKAVDAGCATIMSAYGSIDGLPLTADACALRDILRTELGFRGFVVTDWQNVTSLVDKQFLAENADAAACLAAAAGNDMIMSSPEFFDSALRMVRSGKLSERIIEEAVRNILRIKLQMGLWERAAKSVKKADIGCEAHQGLALEMARRSLCLLKNDGVLPLTERIKSIAVIGANADDIRTQYGDWTYFSHPLPHPEHPPIRPYTTIREGIETLAKTHGISCRYAYGAGPLHSEKDDLEEALDIAKQADAVIYVVGDEISQVGEGKDRADLALSGRQEELLLRLLALRVPLICVLAASKPLAICSAAAQAQAVIAAFNGGAHGGQAIAELLFGKCNPSGRLPISFPRHSGQLPVYYNQLPGWHGENNVGKYCDLPATPLYAFGEGLGYSAFGYQNLRMDTETLTASVEVTNLGERQGLETVQIYFRDLVSSLLTPVKQLIAYEQVSLMPGETKCLSFQLRKMDFSMVNRTGERVVEPGRFLLMAGHSSKDEDLLRCEFALA